MIKVKQFEFSSFGVNTYLAIDDATKQAVVIDPAMSNTAEQDEFTSFVTDNGITITQVVNTHLHLDHCFGHNFVKTHYGVPAKAHIHEETLGKMMSMQYMMFGLMKKGSAPEIDVYLRDGDVITFGESTLLVIHVPGHSEGGIALYSAADNLLFSGDTIFRASIGRTDLPGGDYDTLIHSIREKLFPLPDSTIILPGHGGYTSVSYEKAHNPFLTPQGE